MVTGGLLEHRPLPFSTQSSETPSDDIISGYRFSSSSFRARFVSFSTTRSSCFIMLSCKFCPRQNPCRTLNCSSHFVSKVPKSNNDEGIPFPPLVLQPFVSLFNESLHHFMCERKWDAHRLLIGFFSFILRPEFPHQIGSTNWLCKRFRPQCPHMTAHKKPVRSIDTPHTMTVYYLPL